MNASLSWLKSYIPDLEVTPQEFSDAMTLSGTKVEGYEATDADLDNIIVGRILKIERHPDADKLVVCQVDVGKETVQIVTGATNVAEGQLIPVVLDGGKVAGGHEPGTKVEGGVKIKKGKLRGVESCGMMCSIEELGSTKEMFPESPDNGIYIFSEDAGVNPGDDAIEALGLHDAVVEFEVTSNRPDCFSILGIAREAAATFNKKFNPPVVPESTSGGEVDNYIKVRVDNPTLCPRFCGRVVRNVKIEPSPAWLRRRLASVGIRPINNIVDITNYIMEEYGQPMHAYDLRTIENHEIIVRNAADGETFVTLDGQERTLDCSMLMICDGKKPVGLAGIMGGENSMITDDVSEVLFEAACFDGTNVRKSAKKVGLRTDASGKFEKGLDPNNSKAAIDRACQLVEKLSAGEVVEGIVDVYENVNEPVAVGFDEVKINALLGTDIAKADMLAIFEKLELVYRPETNDVKIPTFRQDVKCLADLAEEVARFFGYDKIPTTLPGGESLIGKLSRKLQVEEDLRAVALANGFSQGMTYSFESPKVFEKLLMPHEAPLRNAIEIQNPLGEDFSIMRTLPVNGILQSLGTNYNHRNKNVRLFELATVYIPEKLPLSELPDERVELVLGSYGEGDFYDMKGVVEEIIEASGMSGKIFYENDSEHPYPFLHPGRQARILYRGRANKSDSAKKETAKNPETQNPMQKLVCEYAKRGLIILGYIGEVHPEVAENYEIGTKAYIAVLDMPLITERADSGRKYTPLAKYPAVLRDISMTVPKEIPAGEVEDIISRKGGSYLESVNLFDVYEGSQIKEGYKSMAYSLSFRSKEKTLAEAEITESMDRILKTLEGRGIELRK
jgi:phenylalanyl-tRNA synthetase beta chain